MWFTFVYISNRLSIQCFYLDRLFSFWPIVIVQSLVVAVLTVFFASLIGYLSLDVLWGISNLYLNIVPKGLLSVISHDYVEDYVHCLLQSASHSRVIRTPICHLHLTGLAEHELRGVSSHTIWVYQSDYPVHHISIIWPSWMFSCVCWKWHFSCLWEHWLCDFNCCVAQLSICIASASGWRHRMCDFYHYIYVINSNSFYGMSPLHQKYSSWHFDRVIWWLYYFPPCQCKCMGMSLWSKHHPLTHFF